MSSNNNQKNVLVNELFGKVSYQSLMQYECKLSDAFRLCCCCY